MANELFDERLREIRELNEEINEAGFKQISDNLDNSLDYIESEFYLKEMDEDFGDFDAGLFVFTNAVDCFKFYGFVNRFWFDEEIDKAKKFHEEFESRLIDAWYQLYLSVK